MPTATPTPRSPVAAPLRWARALGDVVRRVIGVPDYERYLAHVRSRHPGTVPMTREEFARERMESRYNRPGSRCC